MAIDRQTYRRKVSAIDIGWDGAGGGWKTGDIGDRK